MPSQVTKRLQTLFNGDEDANVPEIGWRSMPMVIFDRTHASDTGQGLFRGSVRTHTFSTGGDSQLHAKFIAPPDRREGTAVLLKWHFSTNDVTSGDVRLQIQFNGSAEPGVTVGAANSQAQTFTVDTQYQHYVATFSGLGSSLDIDGCLLVRFGRVGGAVEDTYPDLIYLLGLQVWYQCDRIAVPNNVSPYYS